MVLYQSFFLFYLLIIDNPVVGTNGIVSDNIAGISTYSADDFTLEDDYIIQTIVASGFGSLGSDISVNMTGLDVYIYTDVAGLPSSDPSSIETGVLEILDLSPTDPSLIIADGVFTLDVTAAVGSDVVLTAGTYWLIVAPRVPNDDVRWNWFGSDTGGNAHLIDEGNFGDGLPWTPLSDLVPEQTSLAFTISGSLALSVDQVDLNSIKIHPNPAQDIINIETISELTSVELFSVLGTQVYKGTNERSIDVSNLNTGVYLLKLANETGTFTKRIIKK